MEATGNEARTWRASAKDVAERYGVHRNTVYNWTETTDIPHRRAGGSVRFNLDEVDEWMRGRTDAGREAPPPCDDDPVYRDTKADAAKQAKADRRAS